MAIVPLVDVGLDKCFPVSTFLRISGGTSLLLAVRHVPALAGVFLYFLLLSASPHKRRHHPTLTRWGIFLLAYIASTNLRSTHARVDPLSTRYVTHLQVGD